MDLTTLGVVLALLVGLLGVDTVLEPTSAVFEVSIPAKYDRVAVNEDTVSAILKTTVADVFGVTSLVTAPKIRVGATGGIGMAVAQAIKVEPIAVALQSEVGYTPAQIRLALIGEDGTTKMLVTGANPGGRIPIPPFQDVVTLKPGESIVQLVRRAAIDGLGRLDPYFTALYLVQLHSQDKDFTKASAIIDTALALIAPTPISPERAVFENLQGIMALLQGNAEAAHDFFLKALDDYPMSAIPWLNTAFVEIQLDRYREAADRMQHVTTMQPAPNKIMLATAYMTWGGALLGLHDADGADQMLAKSIALYPSTSAGYDLWADVKFAKGDIAGSKQLHHRALENATLFENYAEVAALWFRLAWQNNGPLIRNPYNNPVPTHD